MVTTIAGDRAHVEVARALRRAVDVDGARTAETGAAAVFGGQSDMVADGHNCGVLGSCVLLSFAAFLHAA